MSQGFHSFWSHICHEPRPTIIVGKTIWWHSEFQAHTKSYLTIGEPLTLYLLLWSFSKQETQRNLIAGRIYQNIQWATTRWWCKFHFQKKTRTKQKRRQIKNLCNFTEFPWPMHYDNNSRRSQLLWSRQQTRIVGDTIRSDKPVCTHWGSKCNKYEVQLAGAAAS